MVLSDTDPPTAAVSVIPPAGSHIQIPTSDFLVLAPSKVVKVDFRRPTSSPSSLPSPSHLSPPSPRRPSPSRRTKATRSTVTEKGYKGRGGERAESAGEHRAGESRLRTSEVLPPGGSVVICTRAGGRCCRSTCVGAIGLVRVVDPRPNHRKGNRSSWIATRDTQRRGFTTVLLAPVGRSINPSSSRLYLSGELSKGPGLIKATDGSVSQRGTGRITNRSAVFKSSKFFSSLPPFVPHLYLCPHRHRSAQKLTPCLPYG